MALSNLSVKYNLKATLGACNSYNKGHMAKISTYFQSLDKIQPKCMLTEEILIYKIVLKYPKSEYFHQEMHFQNDWNLPIFWIFFFKFKSQFWKFGRSDFWNFLVVDRPIIGLNFEMQFTSVTLLEFF